jgi:hypothetical protein
MISGAGPSLASLVLRLLPRWMVYSHALNRSAGRLSRVERPGLEVLGFLRSVHVVSARRTVLSRASLQGQSSLPSSISRSHLSDVVESTRLRCRMAR